MVVSGTGSQLYSCEMQLAVSSRQSFPVAEPHSQNMRIALTALSFLLEFESGISATTLSLPLAGVEQARPIKT